MNPLLQPGANQTLQAFSGTVIVSHDADTALDVNLTAFLLTDAGKVMDDNGLVFYNNPQDTNGMAVFILPQTTGSTQKHQIHFDMQKAAQGIAKLAITLTEDKHPNGFAAIKNLKAEVFTDKETIELIPAVFTSEKGIIVLELYIRNEQAKVKAVWQGFSSGLNGLCQLYGVEVAEEDKLATESVVEKEVSNLNPPSLQKSVITLTKQNDSHKISLAKGNNVPQKILVSATWIDNGDGYDNDDLDLRVGILLPDGRMKIIQAPDRSGSFDSEPYVFHTGDVKKASATEPGKETVEVNSQISHLLGGKVALVFSVYSAIDNGAVSVASLKPKMRMEYGDQIVECAYDFEVKKTKKGFFNSSFSGDIYTYVIGLIEMDGDSITLRPSGVTSEEGSEDTPWLVWEKDSVKLTMDGPPVFKDTPLEEFDGKRYC